jgi:OPA family glycerol-3-phosphate transporter-like MFS transporter
MPSSTGRLFRWQAFTLTLMVLGYAGYYLCRSDFSVALPLLIDFLAGHGFSPGEAKVRLGGIASIGVLAYAFGKFVGGGAADFLGGRRNFLAGMAGSVAATLLFAFGGGLPIFTLAWILNRGVQSTGWVGMVKVTGRWFSYSRYGTAVGILSLSYLAGDAASRQFLSVLIERGFGWQALFLAAAGVLAVLFVLNLIFLKETPRQIGEEEPPANPLNLFGEGGEKPAPPSLGALLAPLGRSRAFWLICLISLGMTLMRETFNTWTPTYFTEAVRLSKAEAASKSAFFPLFGAVSVLIAGFLSDRVGRAGRAAILFGGLLLTTVALLALGGLPVASDKAMAIGLVSLVGFLMIGPYSYLAGAVALDFGGKQGSATACGIIDGIGYLGGVLAGDSVARISLAYGWRGAFSMLAGVAAVSSVAAAIYWLGYRRAASMPGTLAAEA